MVKIAVGGWQHETNTFAPTQADLHVFEIADEWPELCRGEDMLPTLSGIHLPINGAIDVFREKQHDLVPLLWCSATPSSYVTHNAFETITNEFVARLAHEQNLDGIYLDLHGAMVAEHFEDGEGELLRRIRQAVGFDIPIVISLDLHANVTQAMVAMTDGIEIFRTYPHIDMGITGARAAEFLLNIIESGKKPFKAYRQTGFLIPLNWGCTLISPASDVYAEMEKRISIDVPSISFACGFPLSDIYDAGPSIVMYGEESAVKRTLNEFDRVVNDLESEFKGELYSEDQAISFVKELPELLDKPVVLADTQDNPGGGGPGDTTGLLKKLVEHKVAGAIFGLVSDPVFVNKCHKQGVGAVFQSDLGEHSAMPGHAPYRGEFRVLALSDGAFVATGPMYRGARMQLGNCALVETCDVQVIVSSKPAQAADQSMFRHIGVQLENQRVIALKSSVHFRNDFQTLSSKILVTLSSGPVYADISSLRYENLRSSVRF